MAKKAQQSTAAAGLWTVALVKDLLRAKMWKFEKDPWPAWFAERGGPDAVLDFIRSRSISAQFQEILRTILDQPGESREYYAEALKLHPVTVSDYFTRLASLLATHLNQWQVVLSAPAHVPAPSDRRQLPPAHLPALPTSFIGREIELTTLQEHLLRSEVRLITLTGPGGIGKTRLAIQVAWRLLPEFEHGIYFVPLAALRKASLIVPAILQSLGVDESIDQNLLQQLKNYVREKNLLLVIDNLEHLIEAAPLIAELLLAAPRLSILVTSREMLHLYGEQVFEVPPLALPTDTSQLQSEDLLKYDAVRLFIERGRGQLELSPSALTEQNIR